MKTKNMKVLYSTRTRGSSNYSYENCYIETPKISMEGKWLEALGFNIGAKIQVDYEEGAIHIHLAPSEPQPAMVCETELSYNSPSKRKSKKQK